MTIDILGVRYEIEMTSCVSKDEIRLGEINVRTQKIKIDEALDRDTIAVALLHEIIHGIMFGCGLGIDDENLTQSLATGLYQVLRQNQSLFAFPGLRECAAGAGLGGLASTTIAHDF